MAMFDGLMWNMIWTVGLGPWYTEAGREDCPHCLQSGGPDNVKERGSAVAWRSPKALKNPQVGSTGFQLSIYSIYNDGKKWW